MWQALQKFKKAHPQTKLFIFNWALYLIAILWTTAQAYARLEYARSDQSQSKTIQNQEHSDHSYMDYHDKTT